MRRWLARCRSFLHKRELDLDLEQELAAHVDLATEDNLRRGLSPEEARRQVLARLGGVEQAKELHRDERGLPWADSLLQDARFALRMMRRDLGFTAVALLTLTFGIGANAAMFSLVSAILLRPLPYPAADRLVRLTGFYPKGAVVALQEQSRTLEVAGVSSGQEWNLTGQGEAVRLVGSSVSANLFAVLGRAAAVGRTFEPGEDRPGRDRIVLLSHALWQGRFGGDPAAVGRTVAIDGVERQVVGVMPAGFHFPSPSTQLWVPLRLDPSQTEDFWGFGWMPLVARLRPGVSLAQAADELRAMIARISTLFPWPNPSWNLDAAALPLHEDLVRNVRLKLFVLQAAVGTVLLIVCANVASLLLSRAAARQKEMALRAALGAGRGRIVRQLLTESVALSLVGGALGMGLAHLLLSGLKSALPADARGFSSVGVDTGVLAFVTGLSVGCGLFFGMAPAASASQLDPAAAMKAGGQRATTTGGARLRASFIAGEVALAVVLAVGAGLLMRTLWGLTRADPGFRAEQTLTVQVSPNPAACPVRSACVALYEELLRRAREAIDVAGVAAANALPLSGPQPLLPVEVDGHPLAASEAVAPLLWAGAVTPAYFRVMGIPLLQGRAFDDADGENSAPVVVVSAATARRYWPAEDPIGKRIRVVWDDEWRTVVGVVGDVRQYTLSGRAPAEITGALYMPYSQGVGLDRQIPRAMVLFVRSSAVPSEMAGRMRALVASVNPDLAVSDVRSLGAVVSSSVSEPRVMTWLFVGFAGCALLLAAIGTYGVVSYSAAQRTYEIGVRVAVGATRGEIVGLVMGQSLRLVAIGLGLGGVAALALGRSLSSFLYGVSPTDPFTFAAVASLLIVTALLAGYLPGRRAAATDPVRALRAD